MKKDNVLNYFVYRIREQLGDHLKQIILFGSRARGDEVESSDYDCLVVVHDVSSTIKDIIDEAAGDTLYQYDAVISAIIITEEKFQHSIYNPLLMNIAREGVAL
ncbi:MAG: nucleotidyltransferase domain-containing protein [bacterium]